MNRVVLHVGDQLRELAFGVGTIQAVDAGSLPVITVWFERHGLKNLYVFPTAYIYILEVNGQPVPRNTQIAVADVDSATGDQVIPIPPPYVHSYGGVDVDVNPRLLHGPWKAGAALSLYTLSSRRTQEGPPTEPGLRSAIGLVEWIRKRSAVADTITHTCGGFESKYSLLGMVVHAVKYHLSIRGPEDLDSVTTLVADVAAAFVLKQQWRVEAVVPVPPTKHRAVQHVVVWAEVIAQRLGVPFLHDSLFKIRETGERKGAGLGDGHTIQPNDYGAKAIAQSRILVFDDTYGSGQTLRAISPVLRTGAQRALYVLTLARDRAYDADLAREVRNRNNGNPNTSRFQ